MFSHRLHGSIVLLALLTVLLSALLLWSTDASAAPRLPWTDDFDDGNLDGWALTDSGDGSIAIDTTQYVSPGCSMRIRSPTKWDSAIAELDLAFNRSENYVVEFEFRFTGTNNVFELFRDYQMYVLLDNGHIQVQEAPSIIHDIMTLDTGNWYHVKVLYDASTQNNTLWLDGVQKLTFGRDMVASNMRVGDTFPLAYYGEVYFDDFKVYYEDEPVARPPTWSELPTIEAVEDVPVSFDFTPYVWARDLSPELMTLAHDSPYVTGIAGRTVTFRFPEGVLAPTVRLNLSDGRLEAPADVNFTVAPVDDPPAVLAIDPFDLTEDVAKEVELAGALEDEDTPLSGLTIACDDPACLEVNGTRLKLLFPVWRDHIVVEFTVSDGHNSTEGSFGVNLTARNDPPTITGLGNLTAPYTLSLGEGSSQWLTVTVVDEDDAAFDINVTSTYRGITGQAGMVYITAKTGDIGSYPAIITVRDSGGASATASLTVHVTNVNDPPSSLKLLLPTNRSSVVEGSSVAFSAEATDPDTVYGQLLTVTWRSDIAGLLNSTTGDSTFAYSTTNLSIGKHVITVTVTDGEYSRSAWLEITVAEAYVPPEEEEEPFYKSATFIAAIVIVVALVVVGVVIVLAMGARKRRKEEQLRAAMPSGLKPEPAKAVGPLNMEGDLARRSADMSSQDRLEAERRASEISSTSQTVLAVPEAPAEPVELSEEEQTERERTRELREVRRALMNLPQGLPLELRGMEIVELATAIMDGEKRATPAGAPLVRLKGKWYHADREAPDTYMKEWQEPPARAEAKAAPVLKSREEKMARLDALLASGKVTKETYEELKRKYESEP